MMRFRFFSFRRFGLAAVFGPASPTYTITKQKCFQIRKNN